MVRITLTLLLCFFSFGCAAKHSIKGDVGFVIPASCMHVRIVDFQKPCKVLDSIYMLCDQVKVKVNCVGVKQ